MSLESIQNNTENIESGEKVFNFLNKIGFNEIRKSDEKFNEWINNLSYEDFLSYTTRLNGIIREKSLNKRFVDGKNVEVSSGMHGVAYLPPYPEQKNELAKEGFDTIKILNNNEDRAILVYYLIQAIHPYSDGNGRTGRLVYEIINNKEINKDELSNLLDHKDKKSDTIGDGRNIFSEKLLQPNKAFYLVNREVVKDFLGEDFLKEYGGIYFSAPLGSGYLSDITKEKLLPEEVILAEKILGEGDVYTFSFRGIALAKLIKEDDSLREFVYKNGNKIEKGRNLALSEDLGKDIFNIDDEVMGVLDEEQVHKLIEIHKELKEKFIRTMIDIFKNPENHKEKDLDGKEYLIKNNFKIL